MFSLFLSEIIFRKREDLPGWLGKGASNIGYKPGRPESSAEGHAEPKPSTWHGAGQLHPWGIGHRLAAAPGYA